MRPSGKSQELVRASRRCAQACSRIGFHARVEYAYNPLLYARAAHEQYLEKFGATQKPVLFLGMNPGPWGMAQTGVPFGEVSFVRDWMGISAPVGRPVREHPRVPVTGFGCSRSEVSGKRLWGLMRERFGSPDEFFSRHFVANYCPLLFLDALGRNMTPDKLITKDREALQQICDMHLAAVVDALLPRWLVGIGKFAEARCEALAHAHGGGKIGVLGIPHPSPASPQANRDWAGQTSAILLEAGIW
ncbi:MAG: uracil-DNA glycosylase family protein [Spirochaetia bacterium]